MKGLRLDHATINSTDVVKTVDFYRHFLNMRPGWRAPLSTDGAWLYAEDGDYPILHIIEATAGQGPGMFDHIAFRGTNLPAYLTKVIASGEWFQAIPVPETPYTQIHHFDPNRVKIEVIFEETLENGEVHSDAPYPTWA